MCRFFQSFCLKTSMHGFKYLAARGYSPCERFLWSLVVFTAVSALLYILHFQWKYHLSRYTLTSLETANLPIYKIPFPAVTVCGINKVQRIQTLKMVSTLTLPEGMTPDEAVEQLSVLIELIEPSETNVTKLQVVQNILDINNITVPYIMKRLAPSCYRILTSCRWKGKRQDCLKIFVMRKTYEGYCCSFNYLGIVNEIVQNEKNLNRGVPKRISSTGSETGLSVLVHSRPEEYHATVHASKGIKVLLHDSYDYAGMNVVKKLVPLGTELLLSLQPWSTHSSSAVRLLEVSKRGRRGCLFADENSLITVKRYSYDNCVMECRLNVTASLCGCVPYYYPYDGANRICNLLDTPCLVENRKLILSMFPGIKNTDGLENMSITYPCDCLPDCNNIYYPTEDVESKLTMNVTNSRALFSGNFINTKNYSVFHVYFGNFMATRFNRKVLYSWRVLLASYGGLLSLFLGFSLISAFEIIYIVISWACCAIFNENYDKKEKPKKIRWAQSVNTFI